MVSDIVSGAPEVVVHASLVQHWIYIALGWGGFDMVSPYEDTHLIYITLGWGHVSIAMEIHWIYNTIQG